MGDVATDAESYVTEVRLNERAENDPYCSRTGAEVAVIGQMLVG